SIFEVRGNAGFGDAAGIGARRMQESATGAAGAIDNLFIQEKEIVGIVVILLADHVRETGPTVTNADDLVAFADGAKSNRADGRIETGNVAASRENADDTFLGADVSHDWGLPFQKQLNTKLSPV